MALQVLSASYFVRHACSHDSNGSRTNIRLFIDLAADAESSVRNRAFAASGKDRCTAFDCVHLWNSAINKNLRNMLVFRERGRSTSAGE